MEKEIMEARIELWCDADRRVGLDTKFCPTLDEIMDALHLCPRCSSRWRSLTMTATPEY